MPLILTLRVGEASQGQVRLLLSLKWCQTTTLLEVIYYSVDDGGSEDETGQESQGQVRLLLSLKWCQTTTLLEVIYYSVDDGGSEDETGQELAECTTLTQP